MNLREKQLSKLSHVLDEIALYSMCLDHLEGIGPLTLVHIPGIQSLQTALMYTPAQLG